MATPRLLGGRYEIVRRLRVGRIVQVYEGIDQRTQQRVAIELLRDVLSNDRAITARFMSAGKTAGGLAHPHIAKVYATAEEQGAGFLVSELVEGPCLRDLISSEGQVKPDRATAIAVEVCEALEYAHEREVLHGCPTPSDVLLTEDGSVKLSGFGIPAAIGTADGFDVRYRAPEQGHMGGDHRSDLYTLGCCLYEMLLGRAPFHGDPQLADRLAARAPAELTDITTRLLSEHPGDRYQDAAETRAALSSYLGQSAPSGVAGRAAHARSHTPSHARSNPIRGSAALVSTCALLAVAAIAAATQVDLGSEQAVSGEDSSLDAEDDTSTPTGAGVTGDGTNGSASSSSTTGLEDDEDADEEKDEEEEEDKEGEEDEEEAEDEEEGEEDDEESTPSTTAPEGTTTSDPSGPPPTSSPSTTPAPSTVPGVVGMTESQAGSTLSSHGLSMSVQRVRVYDSSQDGKVISQSPGGGAPKPSSGTVSVQVGRWCLLIC